MEVLFCSQHHREIDAGIIKGVVHHEGIVIINSPFMGNQYFFGYLKGDFLYVLKIRVIMYTYINRY